jgi:predicted extracellular nuclease
MEAVVGTFNVENLAASDRSHLDAIAGDVVHRLGSPDVLAVQEIEDDNGSASGTLSAEKTFARLVDAIGRAGGPGYAFVDAPPDREDDDGGRPGANIRVGYLYQPDRVRLDAAFRLSPADPAWSKSRKPLVGQFCVLGRRVWLVNVHLVSKLADDPLLGAWQPPREPSVERRDAQAAVLARWVVERLSADPQEALVVLGDFNDTDFSVPVTRIARAGLEDLIVRVPEESRYTYGYRGGFSALDHVLASPSLAVDAEVDIVHLNADFAPDRRSSDHDPVVLRLPQGAGGAC